MEYHLAYITAADKEEARNLGKVLIEGQLVACINIIENMESMFFWEGEFKHEGEVIVIAKTKANLVDALIQKVKEAHSYDCPCVVTLPIQNGNPEFLNWIADETREPNQQT